MTLQKAPSDPRTQGLLSRRASLALGASALLLLAGGCGGSQGSASGPADSIAAASTRLSGEWLLVEFQPEAQLEFVLAQLLAAQVNSLVAHFDGRVLSARGMGVTATRTYQIEEAEGDHLKMSLFDDHGARYEVRGQLEQDTFRFQASTPPWRGRGVLRRR